MIASLMPGYPSPALADVYHLLPPDGRNLAERVQLLRTALAANPKQLFTAVMLADALVAQKNFAEAEALLRSSYAGNAMPGSLLTNWPAYYAYNLLLRGRHEMQSGHHALALSMMQYALNINKVNRITFDPAYRKGQQPWRESGGVKPGHAKLIQTAEKDVHLLRLIGTAPDDSWQQPMAPGGKPALYQAWQNQGK
jgi:tetratricopeptide (TPR) repeat protein